MNLTNSDILIRSPADSGDYGSNSPISHRIRVNRSTRISVCAKRRILNLKESSRAGEILRKSAKDGTRGTRRTASPGNSGKNKQVEQDDLIPTLANHTISLDQSSKWQKPAATKREFHDIISDPVEVPTTLGVSDRWNRQAGKVEPKPKPKSCQSCQGPWSSQSIVDRRSAQECRTSQ